MNDPMFKVYFAIGICIGCAIFAGLVWLVARLWNWDSSERPRRERPDRDSVARARRDAIRASHRIGQAAWRASRALMDASRDSGRDQNGR